VHPAGHAAGSRPPSLPRSFADLPADPASLPTLPSELWQIVDAGLIALGLDLRVAARAAIEAHLRLLLAWNEHVNLTALRTVAQVARGHVLDSLSAVPVLSSLAPRGRAAPTLLDLGSGGGFPGLPLAVALPAARCALVDSVGKKAAFLRVAAQAADAALRAGGEEPPAFSVHGERAEDLADEPDQRAAWDFVLARAVGSLAEVAELALPLVRIGGHVVAWKNEPVEAGLRDEINAARRLVQAAGGARPIVIAPDRHGAAGLASHRLVLVLKSRPTPARYPRQPAERRRAGLLR
jgi:16S rRNA (guanine527-N7)-methyltransferase